MLGLRKKENEYTYAPCTKQQAEELIRGLREIVPYANREDLERNLPQSNKAENVDVSGAYAVSKRGGMAHEPAVEKPRRRGGKQMKTYGEEDL